MTRSEHAQRRALRDALDAALIQHIGSGSEIHPQNAPAVLAAARKYRPDRLRVNVIDDRLRALRKAGEIVATRWVGCWWRIA